MASELACLPRSSEHKFFCPSETMTTWPVYSQEAIREEERNCDLPRNKSSLSPSCEKTTESGNFINYYQDHYHHQNPHSRHDNNSDHDHDQQQQHFRQAAQDILMKQFESSKTSTTMTTTTRLQGDKIINTENSNYKLNHNFNYYYYSSHICEATRSSRPETEPCLRDSSSGGLNLLPSRLVQGKTWFHLNTTLLLCILFIMPACFSPQAPVSEAIKLQPDGNKYLWSGDSTVVSCRNNNNVKNAKTRWIGPDGHDITEDKSKRIHTESAGARLVIMNAVAQQDDGQYKCLLGSQAVSAGRWEEADFQLQTYKRPSFEGTESRVLMQEELAGQLVCRVEFDPAASSPTVTWSRAGTPIDEMRDPAYRVTEYDVGSMESKLLVKPVRRSHAGSYTCHAIAETLHLSRPFEHTIELDVQFGPTFNSTRETVWVERRLAQASSRQHPSGGSGADFGQTQQSLGPAKRRLMAKESATQVAPSGANSSSVLVELQCVCDSNPGASIVWSSGSSRIAIMKGTPAHVVAEPTLVREGLQTKSSLLVEYQLSPSWEFRHDEYICSASNMIGQATKRFSIQQGDSAPAFVVGPRVDYDQASSLISFVILGPKSASSATSNSENENENNSNRPQQPDVDAFRVRVDAHSAYNSHNGHNPDRGQNHNNNLNFNHNDGSHQHQSHSSTPKSANSVILALRTKAGSNDIVFPQNVTVSLASLPAGMHRLYLEAHNPVGWSRHRTDLGEFKLVSSSANSLIANQACVMLACFAAIVAFAFSSLPARPRLSATSA